MKYITQDLPVGTSAFERQRIKTHERIRENRKILYRKRKNNNLPPAFSKNPAWFPLCSAEVSGAGEKKEGKRRKKG